MTALSFTDAIAVVALFVSLMAFFVAIYAIYQAARYRRGDILIEVARERAPLEDLIRSLGEQVWHLRPDLFSAFPSRIRSDEENKLDREVQRIGTELSDLRGEVARLPATDALRTHFRAEQVLASLIRLRVRAVALEDSIAACRVKVDAAKGSRFPRLR